MLKDAPVPKKAAKPQSSSESSDGKKVVKPASSKKKEHFEEADLESINIANAFTEDVFVRLDTAIVNVSDFVNLSSNVIDIIVILVVSDNYLRIY